MLKLRRPMRGAARKGMSKQNGHTAHAAVINMQKTRRAWNSFDSHFSCLLLPTHGEYTSNIGEALRLEIKRCFTALRVERHRAMLMRDHPLAINLAEANGGAQPHILFLSIFPRSAEPV